MVNGSQQTIRFHADDVMSSHIDPKVNDEFEEWLNEMYGEYGEVKSTRGDVHDYLGMKFAFDRNKQEVKIDMCDCVNDMVDEFPVKFNSKREGNAPTTAATTALFEEDLSKKLSESERETFHKFTAKALFSSKRARQDMSPVASVLCTRVKSPGRNDWNKLVCCSVQGGPCC